MNNKIEHDTEEFLKKNSNLNDQINQYRSEISELKQSTSSESKSTAELIESLQEQLKNLQTSEKSHITASRDLQMKLKQSELEYEKVKYELNSRNETNRTQMARVENDLKLSLEKMNDQNVTISTMQFEIRHLQTQLKESQEKVCKFYRFIELLNLIKSSCFKLNNFLE